MTELLTTYSLSEILMFVVALAVAFKGVSTFIDWVQEKRKKDVLRSMLPESLENELKQERDERKQQIANIEAKRERDTQELHQEIAAVAKQVSSLTGKIDILVESDKDDIKAFITREYHYFCEQKGWIDDYSMDCIEKRYNHYVEENGNSFVGQLMTALRALPRKPK